MLAPRLMMIALALISAAAIWSTLGQTPAFNPRLVSETLVGQGRLPMSHMMYDRGLYDFQRGYGFLMANTVITGAVGAQTRQFSPDLALERAERADAALQSAVRIDPGNAHAWAALAWARAKLGDREGALSAWRVSYRIAPYNKTLAGTRLNLAGVLSRKTADGSRLTEADFDAIARDLDILGRFEPRRKREILATSSIVAAVDQARLRN
ncbi:hypothetical protein [Ovoidimarina sediminis]|uniref:hypothetical protein n=1 Tax=Ovoidimarina sediminis TaxID=3079856 RepID=UPI00290E75CD|nr:hypothetical protein [Rhodophyticola sp. MJ-SS7]MDU8944951.1 hypothetical protein [Rhodophyticola sp. MJ-SS7]